LTNGNSCCILQASRANTGDESGEFKKRNGRQYKMKYFGAKSVSSVVSVFLAIAWPLVLIVSICSSAFFGAMIFSDKVDSFVTTQMAKDQDTTPKDLKDWEEFRKAPAPLKALIFPYGAALVVLLLMIIRKSKELFDNFKKEIIFNKANVDLMRAANKLLIIFSIMTFNISGIFTCIMLFMLAEIFKNGTELQEEHDLTV
jgi:hypothetical protein